MLTNRTKILHLNKRNIFQLNSLGSPQWLWQRCCDADVDSACARLPCCLTKGLLKRDFLDVYLTTFLEFVFSKIQNLWGSPFLKNGLKLNIHFKNAGNNSENVFSFWDNCIWIGIVKLSLFRTGYFSSAANVLTSSPTIWHVNKRDLFQLNSLGRDQWTWWRFCNAEFKSAWTRLPSCFWICLLKWHFLGIYLTTFP